MMTSKETIIQIAKMIASGKLPKELYDKYLSDCPIGFMNEENLIKYLTQDLERLEVLETSVLEYKDQEKLYWQTNENNVKLRQENEKLKKAIEILKDYTFIEFDDVDIYLKSSNCPLSYQEYELLKEVMNNENHSE